MERKNAGFTLVELALVLVVIGILIGAIAAGSGLLKGAELSGLVSDIEKYQSSMHTFRDRYNSLPGDMPDATDYWAGVGNGNGDGQIAPRGSQEAEHFTFWQHLALSGLIDGTFTGVAAATGTNDADLTVNVPEADIDGVGFYVEYIDISAGINAWLWDDMPGSHLMYIGTLDSGNVPSATAFSTIDAEAVDSKMDDGRPGTGMVTTKRDQTTCNTNTTNQNTADYNFATTDERACSFIIKLD